MATVANTLRDKVRTALIGETLADIAEIPTDEWAQSEADGGHVFERGSGFIRGRNRGRIPFLEYEVDSHDFQQLSVGGGLVQSKVKISAHVGGNGGTEALTLASDLLSEAVAQIRAIANSYCPIGPEAWGSFKPGPWGHILDVTMSFTHTYGRAS